MVLMFVVMNFSFLLPRTEHAAGFCRLYGIVITIFFSDKSTMFSLVQFIEDGIMHVCPTKDVLKSKGKISARWLDKHFYLSKVLLTHPALKLLHSFQKNIERGLPRVVIQSFKCTPGNNNHFPQFLMKLWILFLHYIVCCTQYLFCKIVYLI